MQKKLITKKIKFKRFNEEEQKWHNLTVTVKGRTEEETNGRVEKAISSYCNRMGYELR